MFRKWQKAHRVNTAGKSNALCELGQKPTISLKGDSETELLGELRMSYILGGGKEQSPRRNEHLIYTQETARCLLGI